MFHLLTHAFFKALLFLGAGSVMHAMGGVIDIRRLGGLRRRMPVTHWTFLFGCLAMAGVLPFAGFWSKDAILLAVQQRVGRGQCRRNLRDAARHRACWESLLIDFYMFRPFFLTFYGPERIPPEAGHHAHESPGTMTVPLVVLAFGATVVGAYFEWTHGFAQFLAATPSLAYLRRRGAASRGRGGRARRAWASPARSSRRWESLPAAVIYLGTRNGAARLARLMNVFGLYSLSYGKFFFDPLYTLLRGLAAVGHRPAGRLVRPVRDRRPGRPLRQAAEAGGRRLAAAQNGLIQFYALVMVLGLLAVAGMHC